MKNTLYQVDNKKQLRVWSIWIEDFRIIMEYGVYNGKMQRQSESILRGKGGRSLSEQIESRIKSRINKQLAKGYRRSIMEAQQYTGQNELNLYKPMLAQQFNNQRNVNTDNAVLQRKLDGNRMLVTKQNRSLKAYSRNGKEINTVDHILEHLDWLEEGQTIDGEVYRHGMALKDIRGGIAKKQESTRKLKYHIYDVVDDRPFKQRFSFDVGDDWDGNDVIVFEQYWNYTNSEQLKQSFDSVRKEGYEGLIMRLDGYGYEVGKRSKALLKIKHRYDAEYPVIDIETGKDGAAVLVMRLPNGKVVKGVAPGTIGDKQHVAMYPDKYIGKEVTCSFAYLTNDGIPFHLTCDNWRF